MRLLVFLFLLFFTCLAGATLPVGLSSVPEKVAKEKAELILRDVKIRESKDIDEKEQHRLTVIDQEAFNYGIDSGVHFRGSQIKDVLKKYRLQLFQTFDFGRFIINGNILLPKATVNNRIFDQVNDKKVRTVKASYTLTSKARIVSNPPSWEDYLHREYEKPVDPIDHYLPRNEQEKAHFEKGFMRGWRAGIKQANLISEADWIKLTTDYLGHYDFKILAAQNIVTYPTMDKGGLSIYKTNGGDTLYIGDVIAEIATESTFRDMKEWTPYFEGQQTVEGNDK